MSKDFFDNKDPEHSTFINKTLLKGKDIPRDLDRRNLNACRLILLNIKDTGSKGISSSDYLEDFDIVFPEDTIIDFVIFDTMPDYLIDHQAATTLPAINSDCLKFPRYALNPGDAITLLILSSSNKFRQKVGY